MTSVLIVDDHPIVRQACRATIEEIGAAVYEASDAEAAEQAYRRERPDMAIVDLALRGNETSGLHLLSRLHSLDCDARLLAFSMYVDPHTVAKALRAGAIGYARKDAGMAEFLAAYVSVLDGKAYLAPELAMEINLPKPKMFVPLEKMSARQLTILRLLSQGKSYVQIADELLFSYKTITNDCSNICRVLDLSSRNELVLYAVQNSAALTK